jgi:hypothetical protein
MTIKDAFILLLRLNNSLREPDVFADVLSEPDGIRHDGLHKTVS